MTAVNNSYIVICEGMSEYVYLQKLNRFLRENNYSFTFIPKTVGTGHFKAVQKKYRSECRNNPKFSVKVWVDKDTYIRNDAGDGKSYACKNIPDFLFSCMNFEDFLALHTESGILENWHRICCLKKHHRIPLKEQVYLPLVKEHLFPDYEKGDIPFEITQERLKRLFEQKNVPTYCFRCGFADFLEELMFPTGKTETF